MTLPATLSHLLIAQLALHVQDEIHIPVFLKMRSMDEYRPTKNTAPVAKAALKRAKPAPKQRKQVARAAAPPAMPARPASPFDALFGPAHKELA